MGKIISFIDEKLQKSRELDRLAAQVILDIGETQRRQDEEGHLYPGQCAVYAFLCPSSMSYTL